MVFCRPSAGILTIVQEARDLPLQFDRLPHVGEGSGMFEELALDFGRQRTPSHDDGRAQIFQNFLFFGESPFEFQFIEGRGGTAFILPARNRCGEMVASIGLLIFSGGHPLDVGWLTALYQ
jgi:hypothetical protein